MLIFLYSEFFSNGYVVTLCRLSDCVQYYDSVHLASDQKDLLISQLKAEIFEIEQRDKDYLALRDQLYTIQTKYRHLQDEKLL